MQQTLESPRWMSAARVKGALRYHLLWMGKAALGFLLVLLGAQLLALLMAAFNVGDYVLDGVSTDFGAMLLLALICACVAAGRATRFLLRFGTSRLSVWLCNLAALFGMMAAFLLATLLMNLLLSGLALALNGLVPGGVALRSYGREALTGGALIGQSLLASLRALPMQLLWTLEWVCLFYLLGCCLRRNKGLTLAVTLGVPFALMLLMLIPAVNQTIAAVESANDGEIMVMGLQWMQWLSKLVTFVREKWQWIQLGAAVASLPLSYLCMRDTPQP